MTSSYKPYLWERMQALHARQPLSTHTPGHKNGLLLPEPLQKAWGSEFASYDFTELAGLDNLHFSSDCIADSQRQAAEIFGAGRCFYLVNGTTAGLQAAIMATCSNQKVFVPRHVHRSIYHSMLLAHAIPVYLPLELDAETGLPFGISLDTLAKAIEDHPDCHNLILVNPTYQGITGNNIACVELAKAHGLTVIVDEAHGSHLHFHKDLPPSLLDAGADLVVQSWHKTLPVMTQGSALLVNKNYTGTSPEAYLSVLQTTSPSYLLMASLELGAITMGEKGREMIASSLPKIFALHEKIAKTFSTLQVLWKPEWNQDPFKLYLLSNCATGAELDEYLREHHAVYSEMQDNHGILFILPLEITDAWIAKFEQALRNLDQYCRKKSAIAPSPSFYCEGIPSQVYPLQEAFVMEKEVICWSEAANQVAGQFILRYPPGIPLLVPGELITREIVDLWLSCGGKADEEVTVIQIVSRETISESEC